MLRDREREEGAGVCQVVTEIWFLSNQCITECVCRNVGKMEWRLPDITTSDRIDTTLTLQIKDGRQ